MEEARFTLRIHPIIMNKMKHLAKINGRSVNKEIEQILKWVIDDYERQYGKIELTKAEVNGLRAAAATGRAQTRSAVLQSKAAERRPRGPVGQKGRDGAPVKRRK